MRHLNNLKYMAMALFVAMLSLSFTACSDDDDDNGTALDDYYIACEVSGDDLSRSQLAQLQNMLGGSIIEATEEEMTRMTRDEAIYEFNRYMDFQEGVYKNGYENDPNFYIFNISGTVTLRYTLYTKDDKAVKSTTFIVKEDEGSRQ